VAQWSSAEIKNWSDIRLYLLYSGAKMLKVAIRVSIRILLLNIKSVAYSSQGSLTGQLDSATDRQMAARRDNVISITLRQV